MQLSVGPYQSLRVVPSTGDACCSSCARGGACEGTCPASPPSPMDALRRREKATGWPSYGRTTGDGEAGTDDEAQDAVPLSDPDEQRRALASLNQKWANLGPAARRDALERIGRAAGLSGGETERMVASLVNAGLGTVNQYLRSNAQIEIRRIEANRDVAIARIRAQGGGGVTPIDGGGNQTNGEQVISTTQRDTASSSDNSTLLYVGLAIAAVWAMKGKR